MSHAMAPSGPFSHTCDGQPFLGLQAVHVSSEVAHLVPGVCLIVLGVWQQLWVYKHYLTGSSAGGKYAGFRSQGTYPVLGVPLEGVVKVALAIAGLIYHVFLAHGGWPSVVCPSGTPHATHFDVTHLPTWMNIWTLLMVLFAGFADLFCYYTHLLPHGTDQAFTAVVFLTQALVLYESQHLGGLESALYLMLNTTIAGTVFFSFAEMINPASFIASAGKAGTLCLQGIWYLVIARFLFKGIAAWQDMFAQGMDMAPMGMAVVVYVMWVNAVSVSSLIIFLCLRSYYGDVNSSGGSAAARAKASVEPTLAAGLVPSHKYTPVHQHATADAE